VDRAAQQQQGDDVEGGDPREPGAAVQEGLANPTAAIATTGSATEIASSRQIQGIASPTGRRPPPRTSTPYTTASAPAKAAALTAPNVAPSSTSLNRRYGSMASGPASISTTPSSGSSTPPVTTWAVLPLSISAFPVGASDRASKPTPTPVAAPHTTVEATAHTGSSS
jgi:hypothetical protein